MFRASDFAKLICKLVKELNVAKSLSKLGNVMCGSVKNKRMSSAKADSLYVVFETDTPLMSGLDRRRWRSGSSVRTKINGESGHPWRVSFDMEKAFDR